MDAAVDSQLVFDPLADGHSNRTTHTSVKIGNMASVFVDLT